MIASHIRQNANTYFLSVVKSERNNKGVSALSILWGAKSLSILVFYIYSTKPCACHRHFNFFDNFWSQFDKTLMVWIEPFKPQ